MASAWGSSWGSAWGSSWGVTSPVVVDTGGGGGIFHLDRRRTKDELRADRERFGVIPKKVEQVIQRLALAPDSSVEKALETELKRLRLVYRDRYAELLRYEIQRRDEDEIVLLLLMH